MRLGLLWLLVATACVPPATHPCPAGGCTPCDSDEDCRSLIDCCGPPICGHREDLSSVPMCRVACDEAAPTVRCEVVAGAPLGGGAVALCRCE